MSNAAHSSLLRRLMGRSPVTVEREIDPADMGTAMGLDFCLDEPPTDAATTTALAQAGRGSLMQANWLRRLSAS